MRKLALKIAGETVALGLGAAMWFFIVWGFVRLVAGQ